MQSASAFRLVIFCPLCEEKGEEKIQFNIHINKESPIGL